jgi:hypothetical protein
MINKIAKLSVVSDGRRSIVKYAAINVSVFVVAIIFAILFFVVVDPEPLPCLKYETVGKPSLRFWVNLAYLFFLSLIALILAVFYIGFGVRFVSRLYVETESNSKKKVEAARDRRIYIFRMVLILIPLFEYLSPHFASLLLLGFC